MHRCSQYAKTVLHPCWLGLAQAYSMSLQVLLVDNSWDRILINLSCLFHSWAHSWACMMNLYPKDLSRWGIEGTVRSDLALAAFNSEIALSLWMLLGLTQNYQWPPQS
jgi:hypothetical protein